MMKNISTIMLAGGGTGGATAPVLAVASALRKLRPGVKFILVGHRGVEQKMLAGSDLRIRYLSIPAGKWRRYFSVFNFLDLLRTAAGFMKSLYLIRKIKPDVIFGAGSFVQVPLCFAAFLLGVPVVIHQPDIEILLSTKITAPLARAITVSFSGSGKNVPTFSGLLKKIRKSKITVTGNPVRPEIFGGSPEKARQIFSLNDNYPVILVIGGSQGAQKINEVIMTAAPELVKYAQIIHARGAKSVKRSLHHPHYHGYAYIGDDLKHAYARADFVISRGGISTLSELAALNKPAVVVPLPGSAQEANARLLAFTRSAVVVFEKYFSPELVTRLVRELIWDAGARLRMAKNIGRLMPARAAEKIANIILQSYDR